MTTTAHATRTVAATSVRTGDIIDINHIPHVVAHIINVPGALLQVIATPIAFHGLRQIIAGVARVYRYATDETVYVYAV